MSAALRVMDVEFTLNQDRRRFDVLHRTPAGRTESVCAVIALVLLCVAWVGGAHAQYAPMSMAITPDARSEGMGRAFTAVAEGPTAVWWNPGALGFTEGIYYTFESYHPLAPGLAEDIQASSLGVTIGRDGLGLGAYLGYLNYGKSMATRDDGFELGTFSAKEQTAIVGVGADLARILGRGSRRFRFGAGASGKSVHCNWAPAWATAARVAVTGSAWDLDAGLLGSYTIPVDSKSPGGMTSTSSARADVQYVRFAGGMVVRNLLRSSIDYGEPSRASDPLERSLRLGGAVEARLGRGVPALGPLIQGALTFDIDKSLSRSSDQAIYHVGIEGSILSLLTLRMGRIEDKTGDIRGFTFGSGLGLDFHLPAQERRFGARIDAATAPQARGLDRVQHLTASAWLGF